MTTNIDPGTIARYSALDASIRSRISITEFAWMPDAHKATFERDETEPEF